MTHPQPAPAAVGWAEHLRTHAHTYFGWDSGATVRVEGGSADVRRRSTLLRFVIAADGDRRAVVVKVPDSKGSAWADDELWPDRPRLVTPAPRDRRLTLEALALQTIERMWNADPDPGWRPVRVLDAPPDAPGLVMEAIEGVSLRELLRPRWFRPYGVSMATAASLGKTLGRWLRRYHGSEDHVGAVPRHLARADFIEFNQELCEFVGARLGEAERFHQIGRGMTRLAERLLPEDLPSGLGHGDLAARNVVVDPGGTLTILDTLGRFRTAVYEDIGYFIADLRCLRARLPGPGASRRAGSGARLEDAFLAGYFGEEAPAEVVHLYVVQALLDRLAAAIAREAWEEGPRAHVLAELRRRFLLRRLGQALGGIETEGAVEDGRRPLRVAYVMSRFPKLTETFVLYEMIAMEAGGTPVELYPLLRERQAVVHPDAERFVRRAHFRPFLSPAVAGAHLHFLFRGPLRYVRALAAGIRTAWGSWNFTFGAIGTLPKVVCFARDMERRGVGHVHAHFATHPALAALVIHRLTGIPFSFTAHGSDLHVDRRGLDRKVDEAAFAVTVSRFNREVMIGACGDWAASRIHVVHCGVDTRVFRPPETRVARATPTILCVASFEEVKGHRHLVKACASLHRRGIPFSCSLVGDGPLADEIRRLIDASGLEEVVRVLGPRPRHEVVRLMQACDLFVLASHPTREGKREGIPVVLMEAMACGLPVVASRLSGIPELVQDGRTGTLVPPADPEAIARAIERILFDPELGRRMGDAGREWVGRAFSVGAGAKRLRDLIALENTPFTWYSGAGDVELPQVGTHASSPAPRRPVRRGSGATP
jgi:colanic acid/amylovoran biosynthesis glycosyltransferase